jgi:hypothetical protein
MSRFDTTYALGRVIRELERAGQVTAPAVDNVSRLPGLAPVLLRHVWPALKDAPDVAPLGRGPATAEEQCGFWLGYYQAH